MMLVTWASGPPSCSTMLPQKFSATATLNRPGSPGGPDVEHALIPNAAATTTATEAVLVLRMVLIRSRYGCGPGPVKNGNQTQDRG
jgi:hypothetical protein